MDSQFIFNAIRNKYPTNALVPEVSINDIYNREQPNQNARVYKRRIDALMFDEGQRTAIEIKVSRADAKRETWHKTAPWRNVTHRFIYAVPAGLLEFNEDDFEFNWDCGLWWIHDDGSVEVKRKARINKYPEPLPNDVILRLAYRATPSTGN